MNAVIANEVAQFQPSTEAVREARSLLSKTGELAIEVKVGGSKAAEVGPELLQALRTSIEIISRGGQLRIIEDPIDLTTTVAARRIGISRPTLMKMIQENKIEAHKVGTHHRIKTAEADRVRQEILLRQKQAFEKLRALEDELGI